MTDISIITTVYNCEKFINKSLHSILSQKNMPSFEWIICNDGSTDSTWDKIVNFDFKHITDKVKLIDDSENIRIPKRRNKAIKEAKGKYIAIQDGDDNSLDDRMRLLFDYLENNPDIFCVGGKAIRILEDDYVDQIMDYPSCSHEQIVEDLCKKKNPIIDPSCMYRKNIFFELNGYSEDEEIYTVPDMDLWCRAILKGYRLANLENILIEYRINPEGMTQKHKAEMIKAHMIVWNNFVQNLNRLTKKV